MPRLRFLTYSTKVEEIYRIKIYNARTPLTATLGHIYCLQLSFRGRSRGLRPGNRTALRRTNPLGKVLILFPMSLIDYPTITWLEEQRLNKAVVLWGYAKPTNQPTNQLNLIAYGAFSKDWALRLITLRLTLGLPVIPWQWCSKTESFRMFAHNSHVSERDSGKYSTAPCVLDLWSLAGYHADLKDASIRWMTTEACWITETRKLSHHFKIQSHCDVGTSSVNLHVASSNSWRERIIKQRTTQPTKSTKLDMLWQNILRTDT